MQNFSSLPVSISSRGWSTWAFRVLGLLISIAIGVYLLWQIDVQQFLAMVRGLSILSLFAAFLIYMLLNLFRAMRFAVLLGGEDTSTGKLYPIALYHNFLVRTLPFKTGELSYIMMVRHYLKKPVVEGVGTLVSARLFDLLLVTTSCTLGLLTVAVQASEHLMFTLFVPVLIVSAISLYFAAPLLRRGLALERSMLKNREVGTSRAVEWVNLKLRTLADNLDRIHNLRLFVTLIGLSACIYAASFSFNYLLLRTLGIDEPFGTMVVVISIAMFAEALPFSVAGLGLVEGGWTFGLVNLAAMSTPQAASIGFFLHACQLVSVAISGLIGYLMLHTSAFRRSTSR